MNENEVFKLSIFDALAGRANAQTDAPVNNWMIEEPGTIRLLETDYRVKYDIENNCYTIHWGKNRLGSSTNLDFAKSYACDHVANMISMGYVP